MTHRRTLALAAAALTAGLGRPGHAQDAGPEARAVLAKDGATVRLVTRFGRHAGARLTVGKAKAIALHDGEVAGDLAFGHGRVVVALAVDDARAPFRVRVLEGGKLGAASPIARPGDRHDLPFAVAATATPDGFAVFYQEVQADDPSAAHTYLALLDDHGVPAGAAQEVQVPWSLAAAVWNGTGYHLGLYYAGDQNGMRLCMVSLSAAGVPEQHPDWSSSAGYIADVHLVAKDGVVTAFFRGGAGGDRLLERDVSQIGSWGTEPAKAKDLGSLPPDSVIAITDKGTPEKLAASAR